MLSGLETLLQDVAAVHQKLVLACLLDRVRVEFVESESLAQAFAILRPGFPRLKKEFALTSVLPDLHAATCLESDQWLREAHSVTLVHRSTRERNEWLAWDGQRRSMLLAEDVVTETEETTHFQVADEEKTETQHKCVSCAEMEAMTALIRERMRPDATLSVCTGCPRLFETLRHGRHPIRNAIAPLTAELPAFVGPCLMSQTVRLLKQLVQAFDFIPALLAECAELLVSVQLNECPAVPSLQNAQADAPDSANSESWLVLPRFVRQMQALEADFCQRHRSASQENPTLPPMRDALWDELRALDALLLPFTWIFTLSETTTMTSAQYGLLWLWLGSVVQNSSEILKHEQSAFLDDLLAVMRQSLEPHHWASMLLDPRVHGVGLSATGKRKIKALVVYVAQELVGDEQLDPTSIARVNLLTQLGHYVEKTAQFADPIAWEMSVGNAPELFWKDYAQDAQELARVAQFVTTFQPHTRTATELFRAPEPHAREAIDSEGWPVSFPVRRIRYHHLRNTSKRDQRSDAVGKRFAPLLRPFDPSVALKTGETVSPLDPTSVVDFVATLVAMDLQHSVCPCDPIAARAETSVDASWFVWQSVEDQQTIEQTLQRSISTSVASQAAAV